ncbi:hypothetical protein HBH98_090380 [Parastagonospora nodorum]|uniref:Uncharacterized protein n=1 Tax=Phaeosphaeria nodorum (strain SN15 / ATCC MYA-4574 / FGSC 10173) TaxID=321614 RepID=A0A7U2HZ54_PHANO|nr:hypothetical protein HBH53_122130 [Parastagonospora nodorum]QRC97275.1 hypothetical protein JI435_434750 [Parastagonospora nodorum SN15]KAH3969824.1 hypothetical protein HBH52_170150 [Parastagonospora nodorum]KAH3973607.1 hypothetical protein HBH51_095350 [Parastagonospora nodorum]KAH4002317.1 hypothetical protein HBI10_071690 [Parastagonospora nodorum]
MTWTSPGHSLKKRAKKFKYNSITIKVITNSEEPKTTVTALTEPLSEASRPDDYSNNDLELQISNRHLYDTSSLAIETLFLLQINFLSSWVLMQGGGGSKSGQISISMNAVNVLRDYGKLQVF